MAHIKQSGLDFQVKVLEISQLVSSSLGSDGAIVVFGARGKYETIV